MPRGSQVMLLVGTNASGLYHPYWEENLRLAVYLQDAVNAAHPTLMRPITLVNERYNQHLTRGSLIIEVGSSGNTLQEAIRAVRCFGRDAGRRSPGSCVTGPDTVRHIIIGIKPPPAGENLRRRSFRPKGVFSCRSAIT